MLVQESKKQKKTEKKGVFTVAKKKKKEMQGKQINYNHIAPVYIN